MDVVKVLTEQIDRRHAAKYWSVLKTRLKKEGSELTTKCSQLKMLSADGKRYKTDVATTELSKTYEPQGLEENKNIARQGGTIAGNARKEIEHNTGKPVITSKKAAELNAVVTKLIESSEDIS